jgi:hypothetical protein
MHENRQAKNILSDIVGNLHNAGCCPQLFIQFYRDLVELFKYCTKYKTKWKQKTEKPNKPPPQGTLLFEVTKPIFLTKLTEYIRWNKIKHT